MTSGVGLMTATHLLLKLAVNHASEDDLRRIAECEARLMLAGFGNYHDLRKPGEITKNFVLGIGEMLNNVDDSEGKSIFCDLDEQLRLAGFDNPFDADNIKELVTILRPYVARLSGATTNWVSDETPRNTEVQRQHASKSRVGILAAVNLLYELEMGIISDYELRQLGEYELNLKTGNDVRSEVASEVRSETRVPVEDNPWPPPTLGTVTNSVLIELSTKLTTMKDLAAKDLMLDKTEKLLQQAGFGTHYGAPKIEELINELEDLRRARSKPFNEETCKDARELPDANSKESKIPVEATPDVSSEVAIQTCKIQKKIEKLENKLKLAGFGEHCSTVQIQELRKELENLKMTQDKPKDTSEAVEVSPKASSEMTDDTSVKTDDTLTGVPLNTRSEVKRQKPFLGPGFVTASYLLCQLKFGDATEDDRRKLAQYEERLKAAGFGSDVKTESAGALGKITNAIIREYNTKLAETSDMEARNLISDEYEEHLKLAGFYEHYSAAQFEEIWTGMAKDLRKAKDNVSSDLAKTSKGVSTEVLKKEGPVVSAEVTFESSKEAASIEVLTTNGEANKLPAQTSSEESGADAKNTQEHFLEEVSGIVTDRTGIAAASYLLFKAKSGQATDDELKKLAECEERLKLAGFSSDSNDQTGAPGPYPGLGKVTLNFFSELNAKMQTDDHETRNHIFVTYIEKLQSAGFAGNYSYSENEEMWNQLEQFFSMQYKNMRSLYGSTGASRAVPIDVAVEASNQVVDENLADEISHEEEHNNSKKVVGDKATEKKNTDASESADGNSGQVAVKIENNITVENVEEEERAAGPCVANENAAEVAREDAIEPAERKLLLKLDSLVKRCHRQTHPCQSRQADSRPKDPRDKHTSNAVAETVEEVSDNLPKTGLSAAFHTVFKVQKGQASEDEIKKFRECEEKLILTDDNFKATASEPSLALGTITFNLLQKFSAEINAVPDGDREAINEIFTRYVNKLKFAGFDIIPEKEEMWNAIEFFMGTVYKATKASKAVSNEEVHGDAETLRVMTDEIAKQVPDKDVSEVSDKIVSEKKEDSIEIEHHEDEALGINPDTVLDEDTDQRIEKIIKEVMFEMACEKAEEAGEKASVVKDNTVEKGQAVVDTNGGCKSNKNSTESTSEAADKTYRLVKFDLPAPPVRPSKTQDTNPKDPRITNVPTYLKPERKMAVARRRLKEQAPIDWFSTDGSKPPPDFDNLYTRLYSELPLSCRAYAFSTRLKGIKEQLININEPLACLLRKEYSNVVEAFDRYLSAVQKRADIEPTNSRWTRVQPNQEKWRREIIFQLFMSLDNLPPGLRIRPLDFSQPLTIRASFVAERLKMVEVKLGKADAQRALLLSKEFSDIEASFATRWGRPLDCPIPGEPYDDRTSRPLPDELEHLRQDKNRAEREYKWFPSAANKQVRDQLTNEFKRQLAIWKDSQV